ncbi:HAD family hydrolase [Peptoniphilus mikwangii]|uniref:hypothetical protein n=1 Tax=Peptoniphilus mikwangii TaxID=1354300 RepID=UPI000402A026|nr:hypothetical protein [Peptoniphilus mikwangii]
MLDKSGWTEKNYNHLKKLIEENKSCNFTNKYNRNYAVSDWDNTSAMFDVEEAVFLYQLFNLKFSMTRDEFEYVLRKDIEIEINSFIDNLIIKTVEYYDDLIEMKSKIELSEIKSTVSYKNFVNMMAYLFKEFAQTLEYGTACYKILYLFFNMSEEDVRDITRKALEFWSEKALQIMNFEIELARERKLLSYKVGIRAIKQQVDLYRELRENNIDVYICSASSQIVVEEFAISKKFGYGFKIGEIAGLELEKDKNGKFLPITKENSLRTYMKGKAEYLDILKSKYNKAPILFMGDSNGDYDALSYGGLKVGLIINIKKNGKINELKKLAYDNCEDGTIYLLQGRDETTGEFISSQDSISLN